MKIAVCGSGLVTDSEVAKKAFEVGREIAEKGILLLTGSCAGYPYEAVKGAASVNREVFGVSPAKNQEEHIEKYGFPTEGFTKIEFTNLGIPGRNFALVKEADAIIMISGKVGSLNEFTIAFHYNKPIGVLSGSGGITEIIEEVSEVINKTNEKESIVYSSDPKELVQSVIDKLNQ